MIRAFFGVAGLAAVAVLAGCGRPVHVKEAWIEVPKHTPLIRATQLLERYAAGQPLGSEATSFEYLVNEVRKTDPTRADILEEGFAGLMKPAADVAGTAKKMLKQLAPKMTGG